MDEKPVGLWAQTACIWEATARKPGNVHRYCDFPDTTYLDFLLSAAAIAPVLQQAPHQPVGETILEAVRAQPAPLIGFSPERDREHREMKKFLRARLYHHQKMQSSRLGAGQVLKSLFEGFMADVARMPAEHREAALALEAESGAAGRARAVADYIAGMTDRYAFQEHARLRSL